MHCWFGVVVCGLFVAAEQLEHRCQQQSNNSQVATTSKGSSSERVIPVELSPGIVAGFGFIILNCACVVCFGLFNKRFIPKTYGRVSMALYATYLAVSFLLLFGAFP